MNMICEILSSVFLMIEMFDLRGNDKNTRKNCFWIITENPYRFYEVAGHV